jgi:hypothetical protein
MKVASPNPATETANSQFKILQGVRAIEAFKIPKEALPVLGDAGNSQ